MSPTNRALRPLLAAGVLLAAATACGSDDGGPASSPSDESTVETDDAGGDTWAPVAPNTEPMTDADAAIVDAALDDLIAELDGQTPAMWIGVWDPDTGMHLAASGAATLPDTAATTDDHFRIGSITKTVTAAAVLAEIDDGDLALDDTIADVLPDLADEQPEIAEITVEQLLSMTSGIPDYANLPLVIPQVVEDPTKIWTAEEIIEQVLTTQDLAAPGTGGYSTTNYLILGEILDTLNGQAPEEQLTAVAAEVGADGFGFTPDDDETLPSPASSGYVFEGGQTGLGMVGADVESGTDVSDWSTTWGRAGGGMYATLDDLGAWAASGFGTSLLSSDLGELRLSQTSELPEGLTYGLGIITHPDGWIGHSGSIIGWETLALYNTETGQVLVGAVNEAGSSFGIATLFAELYPELEGWIFG